MAASHATVLQWLTAAALDRTFLAAKLLSPEMPQALRQTRSPFQGITPVPAGHVVELTGRALQVRAWWQPPRPELDLQDGARELRTALAAAVTEPARAVDSRGRVSVDLSGGLDSTAVACAAAESQPVLATSAGSGLNEDLQWATRVADAVGGEHRIFDCDELPLWFAGLDSMVAAPPADEPCWQPRGAARIQYRAAALTEQGVRLHLNGQGGDEVLLAPPAYLPGLLRQRPRRAWRHVRGQAALRRVSTGGLLRSGWRRPRSYARWLAEAARTVRTPEPHVATLLGWEPRPRLAPWASQTAEQLVTSALAAAPAAAVHDDPGVHAAVHRIRGAAWRASLYRDGLNAAGVPTSMPLLSHEVVTAFLRVRPEERTDPWTPKPLLSAALPEHAQVLSRRTKAGYNADLYRGWHAHRHAVQDLLATSRLADLDLVDQHAIDAALAEFGPGGTPPAMITDLIGLEIWLRQGGW